MGAEQESNVLGRGARGDERRMGVIMKGSERRVWSVKAIEGEGGKGLNGPPAERRKTRGTVVVVL